MQHLKCQKYIVVQNVRKHNCKLANEKSAHLPKDSRLPDIWPKYAGIFIGNYSRLYSVDYVIFRHKARQNDTNSVYFIRIILSCWLYERNTFLLIQDCLEALELFLEIILQAFH